MLTDLFNQIESLLRYLTTVFQTWFYFLELETNTLKRSFNLNPLKLCQLKKVYTFPYTKEHTWLLKEQEFFTLQFFNGFLETFSSAKAR